MLTPLLIVFEKSAAEVTRLTIVRGVVVNVRVVVYFCPVSCCCSLGI